MDHAFTVTVPFDEFRVWSGRIRPELERAALPAPALSVAEYVTTEMLNNALDHAGAGSVRVSVEPLDDATRFSVSDDGAGAFETLRAGLGLDTIEDAVLALAKGKHTTDGARHTGEGIFFSARVCEEFAVIANGLMMAFTRGEGPRLVRTVPPDVKFHGGTHVNYTVRHQPHRSLKDVFDEFCPQPELRFSRTVVAVALLQSTDGALVSRSQGRRLVSGLDRFSEIVFDFKDVGAIQQGFADEVFRVWRNAHEDLGVFVINASAAVTSMLAHVGYVPPTSDRPLP
jgi:anti-sigma regulatory factor (Ser/Thr protein kinase)